MSQVNQESLRDEHIKMAEKCKEQGRGLTMWEENFLESILNHLGNGRFLTDKQLAILWRIYEEKAFD
jgi:hypothetical protein